MFYISRHFFSTISKSKDFIEREFLKLDYYAMLQVKSSSSIHDIRKNYFELAKIFHPDKYKGNSSIFKKLSEGYNILKDENKRDEYNRKLKIKKIYKNKSNKSKAETFNQTSDIYAGLKSKYEEDFNKINVDRLFGQFISSPVKNSHKHIRVFKSILERKMSKREYKIHEMMKANFKASLEKESITKQMISIIQPDKEIDQSKSYDEQAKEAILDVKNNGRIKEKIRIEKDMKQETQSTLLKLEYLFYSIAFIYIITFIYLFLRKRAQEKKELLEKKSRANYNEDFRHMNYLYPNLPKFKD